MKKIVLFDIDKEMTDCWRKDFENEDVYIENADFVSLIQNGGYNIDLIVAAGNSFGIMDGGLDLAYRDHFGLQLQTAVQTKLYEDYYGELPPGCSLVVEIPNSHGKKLCYTATMRTPQPVLDPRIVYIAMRSSLVAAYKNDATTVLMPAFCHMTGKVPARIVSALMLRAYTDFWGSIGDKAKITWDIVCRDKDIDDIILEFYKILSDTKLMS